MGVTQVSAALAAIVLLSLVAADAQPQTPPRRRAPETPPATTTAPLAAGTATFRVGTAGERVDTMQFYAAGRNMDFDGTAIYLTDDGGLIVGGRFVRPGRYKVRVRTIFSASQRVDLVMDAAGAVTRCSLPQDYVSRDCETGWFEVSDVYFEVAITLDDWEGHQRPAVWPTDVTIDFVN